MYKKIIEDSENLFNCLYEPRFYQDKSKCAFSQKGIIVYDFLGSKSKCSDDLIMLNPVGINVAEFPCEWLFTPITCCSNHKNDGIRAQLYQNVVKYKHMIPLAEDMVNNKIMTNHGPTIVIGIRYSTTYECPILQCYSDNKLSFCRKATDDITMSEDTKVYLKNRLVKWLSDYNEFYPKILQDIYLKTIDDCKSKN